MANLISRPKWVPKSVAEEFRVKMVALGGRFNSSYDSWNVTDEKMAEATALRSAYPDMEYVAPVNGCTLRFG